MGMPYQTQIITPIMEPIANNNFGIENSATLIPSVPNPQPCPITYPTLLQCELCGIVVNRPDQLESHKKGARHMKLIKMQEGSEINTG